MGYPRWDDRSYTSYSLSASTKSRSELFDRKSSSDTLRGNQELVPELIKVRESRDSAENPESTAVMVGLDVSGSMGYIAEKIAKKLIGKFFNDILQKKPITDPHILFMGIGDCFYDKFPLQVTQFEADNRICDQLTDIVLEGGGGGNKFESYDLAWSFAAFKTSIDCLEKRNKKGYLFTIGDEQFPEDTKMAYLKNILGNDCPQAITPEEALELAKEKFHVFHIVVEEGNFVQQRGLQRTLQTWTSKMGKYAIVLQDSEFLSQVMVSVMAVNEGADPEVVLEQYSGKCLETVKVALYGKGQ